MFRDYLEGLRKRLLNAIGICTNPWVRKTHEYSDGTVQVYYEQRNNDGSISGWEKGERYSKEEI